MIKQKGLKAPGTPKALNNNQLILIKSILSKEMTITTGPAGTGKTFLAAAYAALLYTSGEVDKIVLTRPTVPVSRTIGHLPGTLEEKLAPWTIPITEVLIDYLGKGQVECMVKNGKIEVVPFETIRGRTFNKSFIILDEAQNTTVEEVKAFVTRIGRDSKTIINGDESQSDLKQKSGLTYLRYLLEDINNEKLSEKVGLVEFTSKDIVRSGISKLWVEAFERG